MQNCNKQSGRNQRQRAKPVMKVRIMVMMKNLIISIGRGSLFWRLKSFLEAPGRPLDDTEWDVRLGIGNWVGQSIKARNSS